MHICELCGNTHYNDHLDVCNECLKNIKAAKKEVSVKHPDSKMKLAELEAKAKRLVASQEYAVNKYSNELDVSESVAVVEMSKKIFAKKATKAQLLALVTANSNASRKINDQLN